MRTRTTAIATGRSTTAAPPSVHLDLQTSSAALAHCFPHAKADVDVALTTDTLGKDTFRIKASGLRPKTDYTVFLLEKAAAPFGAAQYIGDFTTDNQGRASNSYQLIVEFADPKDDDGCLGAGSPVTQFDGDASAGVQMMNSGNHFLP
jgi:hypothetical protein